MEGLSPARETSVPEGTAPQDAGGEGFIPPIPIPGRGRPSTDQSGDLGSSESISVAMIDGN